MSTAQKKATAKYKAKQIRVDALINPDSEPELAEAWEALLARFEGSKKKAVAWAILNAKA
jgi:hypothetical protein